MCTILRQPATSQNRFIQGQQMRAKVGWKRGALKKEFERRVVTAIDHPPVRASPQTRSLYPPMSAAALAFHLHLRLRLRFGFLGRLQGAGNEWVMMGG